MCGVCCAQGPGDCNEYETGHACSFFGVPPFEEGSDSKAMGYKGGYEAGYQAGFKWGKTMLEKNK